MYADADPRWHGGSVSGSPSFLRSSRPLFAASSVPTPVQIDPDRGILPSKIYSGASVLPLQG
ncbi:unnamed protein product [Urochloa humidicola]